MPARTNPALLAAVLVGALALAAGRPTPTAADAADAAAVRALPAAAAAADADADASPPSSSPSSLLRPALAAHLRGPHFDYWLQPRHYHTDRLVIQARRLYYLSALAADSAAKPALSCEGGFSAARQKQLADAADAGFLEMADKFRQPAGGWRFFLEPAGKQPQQVASYGQAFALYALSTYASSGLTHAARARALAHATFDEMVARTTPDGAVALEAYSPDYAARLPGGSDASAVGSDGVRALGTHLHFLESLTAYRRLFLADAAAAAAAAAGTAAAGTAAAAAGGNGSAIIAAPLGWTPGRAAASLAALVKAARLLLSMRQGGLVLELRDARDARLPAPFPAARASGGQAYLAGHGAQAAHQLWDAAEALGDEREGGADGSGSGAPLLPREGVLEFARAILDGAVELEEEQGEPQQQGGRQGEGEGGEGEEGGGGGGGGGGGADGSALPARHVWLPHIYRLDLSWQLRRVLDNNLARLSSVLGAGRSKWGGGAAANDNATATATATAAPPPLPPPPPRSALSVGREGWEREINWWTQMEHMLALLRTAQELPAGDDARRRAYVARAARAWALLSGKFADPSSGAFHESVDRSAGMRPAGPTTSAWKASYHSSRAMINGIRALC